MFTSTRPITLDRDPLQVLAHWPAHLPVALLHSGRLNANWSRYSVIAQPQGTLIHERGITRWLGPAHPQAPAWGTDPLRNLDRAVAHDPALYLGFLGYEVAHAVEPVLGPAPVATDPWPDLVFHRCPQAWVYDHQDHQWSYQGPSQTEPPAPPQDAHPSTTFSATPPVPDEPRSAHETRVQRALDYIAAGDIFQVNLAHRFTSTFEGSPRALFAAVAAESPAWYGAYLELPAGPVADAPPRALCSTSPELFLKLDDDGTVTTRPIKGTRPTVPPGPSSEKSPDPVAELRASPKDAAELNMIIDLLRNDLGRVCSYGSVKVTQPRTIETHPTVHHGVATITGRLHDDRKLRHLLRATFPGGSITGAPKIRAMQIIQELEAQPRGPYCGAIGAVRGGSDKAAANLSIAIRTLQVDPQAKRATFSVGGGIVADSDPHDEYEETLHKSAALRAALAARRQM